MLPEKYDLRDVIYASAISRICEVADSSGALLVAKLPPIGDPRVAKRFQREIEALMRAAGPHTMPILDYAEDFSWYVMPRAEGSLADTVVPASLNLAIEVIEAIADALRSSHLRGEVHRDLKPSNILLLREGGQDRWVVSDFGVVRNPLGLTTSDLTKVGTLLGTEGWAPPEQYINAHGVTPAADVYSAGLIAAWLLTGSHPQAFAMSMLSGSPIAGSIARATAAKASRRFANTDDLLSECRREAQGDLATLEDLVQHRDAGDLERHLVKFPSDRDDVIRAMSAVTRSELDAWFHNDPEELSHLFVLLCDAMADDSSELGFSSVVDPLLILGVRILELQTKRDPSNVHDLAVATFGAISEIHQFAPAEHALNALDRLSESEQVSMRAALHQAGAWKFFSEMAANRFSSRRTSKLVRDLANSG